YPYTPPFRSLRDHVACPGSDAEARPGRRAGRPLPAGSPRNGPGSAGVDHHFERRLGDPAPGGPDRDPRHAARHSRLDVPLPHTHRSHARRPGGRGHLDPVLHQRGAEAVPHRRGVTLVRSVEDRIVARLAGTYPLAETYLLDALVAEMEAITVRVSPLVSEATGLDLPGEPTTAVVGRVEWVERNVASFYH